jgi:hypothetical protein
VNTFAILKVVYTFKKVTYYTIQRDGETKDCFSEFRDKHIADPACKEDMQTLMYWLTVIGKQYGAKERYFRHEAYRGGDAKALPPKSLQPSSRLRLYCICINDQSIILLSGGLKTRNKAQDCPIVGPPFREANKVEKAIRDLIHSKEIQIDNNGRLAYDNDLIVDIK